MKIPNLCFLCADIRKTEHPWREIAKSETVSPGNTKRSNPTVSLVNLLAFGEKIISQFLLCSLNSNMLSFFLVLICCIHFLAVKKKEEFSYSQHQTFQPLCIRSDVLDFPFITWVTYPCFSLNNSHISARPSFPFYLPRCILLSLPPV